MTAEADDGFTRDSLQISGMPTYSELADAGLLTDRQAEVFMLRVVEGLSRERTAALMGIDKSTVDHHLGKAKRKIDAAHETIRLLEGADPDEIENGTVEVVRRVHPDVDDEEAES